MEEIPSLDPSLKLLLETLLILVAVLLQTGGANPDNSHTPPSKSPGFRAKPKPKTGRSPGGQEDHPGSTLMPVEEPDEIVRIGLKPEEIPPGYRLCGYESRQVFDIIVTRHVTEYRVDIYQDDAGRRLTAPFPPDVLRKAQYGSLTRAHVVYLNIWQLLPYNRIQSYFFDAGLSLSEGTIFNCNERAYFLLADYERWARWQIVNLNSRTFFSL